MGCSSCGPSRFSVESTRRWKPQSHNGCGCGGGSGGCDTPSLAPEGTPLWEWEQTYGKLVTTVTFEQDEWGRTVQRVVKEPCPPQIKAVSRHGCCSLRYRVSG